MVEREGYVDISRIIENTGKNPVVRLHLASYFRMNKDRREQEKIYASYGLEPCYDPVTITPEIEEKLWEYQYADKNGFFTFLPRRLVLGHTAENIIVSANISLRMRDFFRSEETGETFPLRTNCNAPLIHPGSTGPQTYEIYNTGKQPLTVCVSNLVCDFDVDYFSEPSVLAQQKLSRGEFGDQTVGKIKLGNLGKDWEIQVLRRALLKSS